MDEKKKHLWVFGSAVQDVTVEVDLDRLAREQPDLGDKVRLQEGIHIHKGVWFATTSGLQTLAVEMTFAESKQQKYTNDFFHLPPGAKRSLTTSVQTDPAKILAPTLSVPCDNLAWGGGGVNVVTFARAIAPSKEVLPLRYTDVAMSRKLPDVITMLEHLKKSIDKDPKNLYHRTMHTGKLLEDLYDKAPDEAERLTRRLAEIAAGYSREHSLDVYLASLPVDCLMYRPKEPSFRRNWVFSRVRTAGRPDIRNKIVCKGQYKTLTVKDHSKPVHSLLSAEADSVDTILLDSLKDLPLFQEAFHLGVRAAQKNGDSLVILAMTEAMQGFTTYLQKQKERSVGGPFPKLVFVLNEIEAAKFAHRLDHSVEPLMPEEQDTPNILRFAAIAQAIRKEFGDTDRGPRIYVTLGPHGSLGVDGTSGHFCYVSSYPTTGVRIYDTNGCGDAYCAVVSLLEWATRNGYPDVGKVPGAPATTKANEMLYFMSVATAAAYCKATNRRGRVEASAVRDLLEHEHLGAAVLPSPADVISGVRGPGILGDGRLVPPPVARFQTVTPDLDKLMKGG